MAIQNFMESSPVQLFIVFMVAIYTVLIFVLIALEDLLTEVPFLPYYNFKEQLA